MELTGKKSSLTSKQHNQKPSFELALADTRISKLDTATARTAVNQELAKLGFIIGRNQNEERLGALINEAADLIIEEYGTKISVEGLRHCFRLIKLKKEPCTKELFGFDVTSILENIQLYYKASMATISKEQKQSQIDRLKSEDASYQKAKTENPEAIEAEKKKARELVEMLENKLKSNKAIEYFTRHEIDFEEIAKRRGVTPERLETYLIENFWCKEYESKEERLRGERHIFYETRKANFVFSVNFQANENTV